MTTQTPAIDFLTRAIQAAADMPTGDARRVLGALVRSAQGPSAGAGPDDPTVGKFLARARDLMSAAQADDLAPLRTVLEGLLADAEDEGFEERAAALYKAMPSILDQVLPSPRTAATLERVMASAFVGGLTEKEVVPA